MWKTSEKYKKLVYADGIKHELNIYIDGIKIDDRYVFDFEFNSDLLSDNIVTLGGTPQQEATLTIHKNIMPTNYNTFYIESGICNGEIVPIGYFNVDGISEDDSIVTIKLKDYMYKFEFDYDGSEILKTGEKTLLEVLKDICQKAGVELGSSAFINSDTKTSIYDNTISAKTYLSYIAEQAGGIAYIGRDGKLYIKKLEKTKYTHSHNNVNDVLVNASINSKLNILEIKNNTTSDIKGNINLHIDYIEQSKDIMNLFRLIQIQLLQGNLNINIPIELKNAIDFDLKENGYLEAFVYDIYSNKIDFSLDSFGMLLADIDEDTKLIINQKTIEIPLNNITLSKLSSICYTDTWKIINGDISTNITDENLLNALNSLLNVDLLKGENHIYIDKGVFDLEYTNYVEIPINKFQDFDFKKESFVCSRIYFEDGIRQFKKGDTTNKTIYINSNNPYIQNQSQIDNIYNLLNGLEIYGFEGSSIIDCAIDIGDIVYADDKPILYQGSFKYVGRNKAEISSNIKANEENEVVKKINTDTKIKRIQSIVNEAEGRIDVIAKTVNDESKKVSDLQVSVEGIKAEVSNIETLAITKNGAIKPYYAWTDIITEKALKGEISRLRISNASPETWSYYTGGTFQNNISILKINDINFYGTDGKRYAGQNLVDKNTHKINRYYTATKSLWLKINPNKTYDVTKVASSRFVLATFSEEPSTHGLLANQYVSDENEGEGLTKLSIKSTKNDKWLFIFYYDSNNDTLSETEISNSIIVHEDYQEIDLKITDTLRYIPSIKVYDEFIYDCNAKNKAIVIRRIGVDESGNLYKLPEEQIEILNLDKDIILGTGINYLTLGDNQYGFVSLKYIQENGLTDKFATSSEVEVLHDEINLQSKQKVNQDEIIAKLNLAIKNGLGVVIIEGNRIIIDTDFVKLTENGKIKLTGGEIANLIMELREDLEASLLYASYSSNGTNYYSGLQIPTGGMGNGNRPFLFSGATGLDDLLNANSYITHDGLCKFKWLSVNGESGYFYIDYDSGRRAVHLSKNGLMFKLDNNANNDFAMIEKYQDGLDINLYDAPALRLYDMVHNGTCIMSIKKYNPNGSSDNIRRGNVFNVMADLDVTGYRYDNVNYTMHIQGWEVATNASDKRLKENIEDSDTKAIEIINKIKIKKFDWRKDKHLRQGGEHVNNGFIAQEVLEIDKTLVHYDAEHDSYQMEVLNLVGLGFKGIQENNKIIKELQQTVEKQQKTIDKHKKIIELLAEKLGCSEEIDKILNEDKEQADGSNIK